MEIEILSKNNETLWDQLLEKNEFYRFTQSIKYRNVLIDTYGYKAIYMLLKDRDKIVALLPLIKKNKKLISIPFADYGDLIILKNDLNIESLITELKNYLKKNKFDCIKIISGLNITSHPIKNKFVQKNNDEIAILELTRDYQKIYTSFDYSVKKAIKKANQANLQCQIDSSPEAIKKYFYPLYLLTMKRFGTPPHPLKYFLNKKRYFRNELKIYFASLKDKKISALMGFITKNGVQITQISSDPNYWQLRPNDLLHWEFIRWSCENNFKYFDFGPVRYENQKRYKEKWKAQISKNYTHYLTSNDNIKIPNPKSNSLSIKVLGALWKSLIPISLTKYFGPPVRKRLYR